MSLKDQLRILIGDDSVSAFARKVGLSESLIRKYLKGSEPTLSKAYQITQKAKTNLNWLATGQGDPFLDADWVDLPALETALNLISQQRGKSGWFIANQDELVRVLVVYRHLLSTKLYDGHFDLVMAQSFVRFLNQAKRPEQLDLWPTP